MLVLCSLLGAACGTVGPSAEPKRPRPAAASLEAECAPGLVLDCETACMNGNRAACEEAGSGYLSGKDIAQDLQRARMLLTRACDQGRHQACGHLGKMAQDGQGVEKSDAEIVALLTEGCDAGDEDCCGRLGALHLQGKAVDEDVALGRKLLQQACESDVPRACHQLGVHLRQSAANAGRAGGFLQRACSRDIADACFELADLQLAEKQVPPSQALQNLRRSCDLGSAPGCGALAERERKGQGVKLDVTGALKHHEFACDAGHQTSCNVLADILREGEGTEANSSRALALYSQSCKHGELTACVERGLLLYEGARNVTADQAAAAKAFQKACDGNDQRGCGMLGVMLASGQAMGKDPERAKPLLKAGCERAKLPHACTVWGLWLAEGRHVEQDSKRATELLSPACEREDAEACQALATLYEFAEAGERDLAAAERAYGRACEQDHEPSCLSAAVIRWRIGNEAAARGASASFDEGCKKNDRRACLMLGLASLRGVGTSRDSERALDAFARVCRNGGQAGCAWQGQLLISGDAGQKDPKRGRKLIREACESGDGDGCYVQSMQPGVSPQEKEKLRHRACEARVYEACVAM